MHDRNLTPYSTPEMFPPSIVRAVARLLCAVLVSLAAQRASADPENFELRAPATWFGQALVQSPDGGVTNWGIGAFVYAETWNNNNGWWDGYAALANVAIDPDDGTQHWTFMGSNGWTCTVDAAAVANARNADHVLWLDFEPGSESFTWNFLVSSDYAGHALGLVQPGDGDGPPTVSPLSLGDSISMLSGEGYGPGFSGVRASAPVDSSKPFWVADFTTGLRSQNGATLLRDGWVADAQPHPLVSVSVYFDAISSGDRYTLHWQLPGAMQSEMVQSLTAVSGDAGWQQMGNWGSEDLSGTVGITGSVAVGSNYWVTRDSDGWSSSSWFLNPLVQWPDPIRWALRGMAAPPVPWRTATFNIAAGCGWSAYVAQQDGMRGLTPASTGTLTFSDTDDWGNPHDFYYEQWTTQIDPREPFWLTVNYTQCTQGETWYYNGWTAIGGTPRNFQNVSFGISAGFGGNASVYQGSNGSQGLTLQGTGFRIDDYLNGGPADGTPNVFTYDLWNATLDVNRPFFLSVNGTTLDANQAWYYNGWQWQGGGVPNWQVVNFTIASGYGWSNSFVTQTNNWQSLSFIGQSGYTEDYWNDGSGTPNFFYYDIFSAQVDISRPYTLSVNGQPLDPGVSAFYNGWQWQGGARTLAFTLNLTMNGDRVNHDFTLTAPDGRSQALALSGSQITAEIGLWNQWVPEMWNYSYSTFSSSQGMTWDGRSGVWTLTDAVTSETVTFDPSGSASYAFDLGQWWLPSTSIQLQISLSRWGHELHLRQRDGQDYLVTPGSSQGGLIQTPDGSWFQSYYYFDAGSYRREISGWDWWIYDATTNESSPANASNLIGWIYPATPVNAASWITADNGVEVRWELPAVFDTTILDGGFTIEATDIAGGSWSQVSQNTARNYLRNDASGFQFRFGDSMGTSGTGRIYRVMLSYGGVSSVAAQTNAIQFPSTGGDGGGDGGGTTYQTFTAVSSTVTVSAGGGMTINLQANGGTEPYTFYYGTQTPSQGSLTLAGSAGSYSANASGSGQDSFTFIVQDAAGTSATGTITINIQAAPPTDPPPSDPPPNDPPNRQSSTLTLDPECSLPFSKRKRCRSELSPPQS